MSYNSHDHSRDAAKVPQLPQMPDIVSFPPQAPFIPVAGLPTSHLPTPAARNPVIQPPNFRGPVVSVGVPHHSASSYENATSMPPSSSSSTSTSPSLVAGKPDESGSFRGMDKQNVTSSSTATPTAIRGPTTKRPSTLVKSPAANTHRGAPVKMRPTMNQAHLFPTQTQAQAQAQTQSQSQTQMQMQMNATHGQRPGPTTTINYAYPRN